MVNIGVNLPSLLGLLDVLLGLGLAAIYLVLASRLGRPPRENTDVQLLLIIQAIAYLITLPLAGVILFFNGWRLDPILQFALLLLHFLVFYAAGKDYLIYSRSPR